MAADFGQPIDLEGLRVIVKGYLDLRGSTVAPFKSEGVLNLPGRDWALGYLQRHKDHLSFIRAHNVKKVRAEIDEEDIKR